MTHDGIVRAQFRLGALDRRLPASAQHSRHIDRKLFKMRELRGKAIVKVGYIPTDENTADIFTKVLDRQPFEKHRRTAMNLPGGSGLEKALAAARAD